MLNLEEINTGQDAWWTFKDDDGREATVHPAKTWYFARELACAALGAEREKLILTEYSLVDPDK